MTRFNRAILAGVVASGILTTVLMGPPATLAQDETHHKTTAQEKAKTKGQTRAKVTATHVMRPARTRTVVHTHTVVRPAEPRRIVTRHTTVTRHVTVARHITVTRHVTVSRVTAVRVENESMTRLRTIARSRTAPHIFRQRVSLQAVRIRHAPLRNVTFLTGTIVRRDRDDVIVRTNDGDEIPVRTQTVLINRSVFVPGANVVVPAQFVNGSFTFVPAFTSVDEAENFALPAVAPCAINDRDSDDFGDTGYYAPANACSSNDADGDDGFAPPPLPNGFAPVPQVFSNAYTPVVAAGFVVSQAGPDVVVMTPNFTPLVVNASAAMNSGMTSGPLTVGRYVTIYGYDVNNTLVATSIG